MRKRTDQPKPTAVYLGATARDQIEDLIRWLGLRPRSRGWVIERAVAEAFAAWADGSARPWPAAARAAAQVTEQFDTTVWLSKRCRDQADRLAAANVDGEIDARASVIRKAVAALHARHGRRKEPGRAGR